MSDADPHPDNSQPGAEPGPLRSDRGRDSLPPHPAGSLRLAMVEYADGPDRCTIHPPGVEGVTRMSTWLTADREAFVDLSEWR